jgi:hypothetical protein
MYLLHRGTGTFCRRNRITVSFDLLFFVGIDEGTPRFHHVPLHIVGEHAQKDVSPDTIFKAMANWANHKIYSLEGTKRSFSLAELLIAANRRLCVHPFFGEAGSHDVDTV